MTSLPAFPRPDRLTGIISPMIVWALYFAVVYSLTGIGCEQGWHRERVLLLGNRLTATMAIGTALALALIAWCGIRGYTGWRHGEGGEARTRQRARFMGLVMLVLSALAALGTVLVAIPIFMLPPCA